MSELTMSWESILSPLGLLWALWTHSNPKGNVSFDTGYEVNWISNLHFTKNNIYVLWNFSQWHQKKRNKVFVEVKMKQYLLGSHLTGSHTPSLFSSYHAHKGSIMFCLTKRPGITGLESHKLQSEPAFSVLFLQWYVDWLWKVPKDSLL